MATPTLSIFSGSEDLGLVYSEQLSINVKFWEKNVPFSGTKGQVSVNTRGKTRIIMIQGAHDGENFAGATQDLKLKDFIETIENWVAASTQGYRIYTSSVGIQYKVHCVDWQYTRSFNDPNRLIYSIIMKETGTVDDI